MNEAEQGAATPTYGQENESASNDGPLERNAVLIASLREKHGEIAIFEVPARLGGILIAAVPENPRVTEAFINAANDSKVDKAVAMRNYANASVVFPDREAAAEIFKKKPFLPSRVAARVSEMAGADAKELGKD